MLKLRETSRNGMSHLGNSDFDMKIPIRGPFHDGAALHILNSNPTSCLKASRDIFTPQLETGCRQQRFVLSPRGSPAHLSAPEGDINPQLQETDSQHTRLNMLRVLVFLLLAITSGMAANILTRDLS